MLDSSAPNIIINNSAALVLKFNTLVHDGSRNKLNPRMTSATAYKLPCFTRLFQYQH